MENYKEVKSKNFRFGKIGDFLKGTLLEVYKMPKPDRFNKIATIYRVRAKEGTFLGSTKDETTGKFVDDKEQTIIEEGEEYTFFATGVLVGQMKSVKLGQKFMVKFTDLKPSTKGNDAKIKKVFAATDDHGQPIMDEEWLKEQTNIDAEAEAEAFNNE